MSFFVATTSLPAVYRPKDDDCWNAVSSCRKCVWSHSKFLYYPYPALYYLINPADRVSMTKVSTTSPPGDIDLVMDTKMQLLIAKLRPSPSSSFHRPQLRLISNSSLPAARPGKFISCPATIWEEPES